MKITSSVYILLLWIALTISTRGYSQSYHLPDSNWYQIINNQLSDMGKWTYFTQRYNDGSTKGVLYNVQAKQATYFEKPGQSYLDDNLFVLKSGDNKVVVQGLSKMNRFSFENVLEFSYNVASKFLLLRKSEALWIVDNNGRLVLSIPGVKRCLPIGSSARVVLERADRISILDLKSRKEQLLTSLSAQGLAKIEVSKEEDLVRMILKEKEAYLVKIFGLEGRLIHNKKLNPKFSDFKRFTFLADDWLVASREVLNGNVFSKDTIEMWSFKDKGLKPKIIQHREYSLEHIALNLKTNEEIEEPYKYGGVRPYLVFGSTKILDCYDLENDDSTTEDHKLKVQLRDLRTGQVEWSEPNVNFWISVSRKFRQIFYFKGKDWWMYDAEGKRATNLTAGLSAEFSGPNRLNQNNILPFNKLYFNEAYTKVYLTGRNNIWVYDILDKKLKVLTLNKNPKVSLNIINSRKRNHDINNLSWQEGSSVDENKLVVQMKTADGFLEGLACLNNGKFSDIEPLAGRKFMFFVSNENYLTYTVEDGNTPRALKRYSFRTGKTELAYQSLTGFFKPADFPLKKVLWWKDRDGDSTYCTVILPPGYDINKKYPAIVRIYENEALRYREFDTPGYTNQSGFSASLFALNGYIIVYPRITYKADQPGMSALICTEDAVKQAALQYGLDLKRLGLIGHSFGGYETNFILTRSKLFKAAVSGASLADLTALYFSMSQTDLRQEMWRLIDQQFSMSAPFYNMKEKYYAINPVFHADSITTPMLIWSGREDYHVNWNQSVAMFLALKSLKKEAMLLLYPGEGHVLANKKYQIDATEKFLNWFDYYLNGARPVGWLATEMGVWPE